MVGQQWEQAKREQDEPADTIHFERKGLQPNGPTMILGDLNADPENIYTTSEMLNTGVWTDIGACASRWNGIDKEHTCPSPPDPGHALGATTSFVTKR